MIVSTSFLFVQLTSIERQNVPFLVSKSFSASGFETAAVRAQPLETFFGIATKGLKFPPGTTEGVVVPAFAPVSSPSQPIAYRTNVDGFSTSLQCEVVQPVSDGSVGVLPWVRLNAPLFAVNISTPSCNITKAVVGQGPDQLDDVSQLQQYQGFWGNYTCNDGIAADLYAPGSSPQRAGFDDHRLLMTTSLVRWNSTKRQHRMVWLEQFSTILCKPTYNIDAYTVESSQSTDLAGQISSLQKHAGTSRKLAGLEDSDLVPTLHAAASGSQILGAGGIFSGIGDTSILRPPDQLFRLMQLMKGDGDLQAFMNTSVLLEYSQKAFHGVWTQIADEVLLQPASIPIRGTVVTFESRLQVGTLSFGLLFALLLLLLGLTLTQIAMRPRGVVPREPCSIGAHATLVASSQDVRELISKVEHNVVRKLPGTSQLMEWYSTNDSHGFHIRLDHAVGSLPPKSGPTSPTISAPTTGSFWHPTAFRTWYAVLVLLLPLFVAAALQLLQYKSDRSSGLFDINEKDISASFVTALPVAVLAAVAALFSSLHFTSVLLVPFLNMRNRPTPARDSVCLNLVPKSYIEVIIWSAQRLSYGVFCAAIAALIGTSLTVVGSGLLFFEDVPRFTTSTAMRSDYFDLGLNGNDLSQGDNLASTAAELILNQNLSFPQWTFDNLVFPAVQVQHLSDHSIDGKSGIITLELPALRASLRCELIPQRDIAYIPYLTSAETPITSDISFSGRPHEICRDVSDQTVIQPSRVQFDCIVPINDTEVYVGSLRDNIWSMPEFKNSSFPTVEIGRTRGCRTKILTFGTIRAHRRANSSLQDLQMRTNLHMFACSQVIEEVTTQVTLSMPDLGIDLANRPEPREETARLVKSPYFEGSEFAWLTTSNIRNSFPVRGEGANNLDPFMLAVTQGGNAEVLKDFMSGASSAKLLDEANKIYGIYIAQAISANFRIRKPNNITRNSEEISEALRGPSTGSSFAVTFTDPRRQRLKQNSSVKLALQVMLVTMTICAAVAYFASNATELLPNNPSSIAGMMSLLVEGNWIDHIPPKSEWRSQEQDLQAWQDMEFRLEYYRDAVHNKRYGITADLRGRSKQVGSFRNSHV